jgi:hypothetical protein
MYYFILYTDYLKSISKDLKFISSESTKICSNAHEDIVEKIASI